jgi:hypothetical protein
LALATFLKYKALEKLMRRKKIVANSTAHKNTINEKIKTVLLRNAQIIEIKIGYLQYV